MKELSELLTSGMVVSSNWSVWHFLLGVLIGISHDFWRLAFQEFFRIEPDPEMGFGFSYGAS
jgi:hypothetical protein